MSVEYCVELFDSGATWGPNTKLAEVWDARNLGWSRYDRLAGRAFFTVGQDSPYLALLDKLKTHARITRVATSGNTEVFNGLIVDPDSTGDDVVVSAIDYLGLLGVSRCGYKTMYPKALIGGGIVSPEWTLAKNATGSRVGFIATGTIEDPVGTDGTTKIRTNTTFGLMDQTRLRLFYDLSEMARANTVNHVTYEVTRSGTFTFNFWKNRGSASAIPLVLNGTVSDYQRLQGWGAYRNDLATLGTTTGGGSTEIISKDTAAIASRGLWQDAGSIPTIMGIVGKTTEADQQKAATDRMLQRAKQQNDALALVLVPGAIEPFAGWDICDTMWVEIVNGLDQISTTWRVLGVRTIYDERGETLNLIVMPVVS